MVKFDLSYLNKSVNTMKRVHRPNVPVSDEIHCILQVIAGIHTKEENCTLIKLNPINAERLSIHMQNCHRHS